MRLLQQDEEGEDIRRGEVNIETFFQITFLLIHHRHCRREGYNVLAMGQHLDDLAESFLMSVFHNGRIRTMKANYTVKEGDLR